MLPPLLNDNLSTAAAAAAAAAAKALSVGGSGGRNPNTWPDQEIRDDPNFHSEYSGRTKWPRVDTHSSYSRSRQYPSGYSEDYHPISSGSYRSVDEPAYGDRQFREAHRALPFDGQRGRSRGSPDGYYSHEYGYNETPQDYRDAQPSSKTSRHGGTTLVIGGSTPIHVPKTSLKETPSGRLSRGGSAASVFRGRPEENVSKGPAPEDDSAQKILLSLRTPTMSFEDNGGDKGKKVSGLALSPDASPNQQRPIEQLFERGSDEGKNSGSVDMAPSFNLFNQSFDSLGGDYFHVDSALQNDSFGIGRTGSADNEGNTQLLSRNPSAGNFPTQYLVPSGSGALAIGYSPVNSFGNPGVASRRGGSMMVLGGTDTRTASPTQVLGMYRSYSGGGRSGPLDDSHLRMSVGSFGAQAHCRPYGESVAPQSHFYGSGPLPSQSDVDSSPTFYSFLKQHRSVFKDCVFLLPGLKAAIFQSELAGDVDGFDENENGTNWSHTAKYGQTSHPGQHSGRYGKPTLHDIAVARRRVESSVCAFGGSLNRDHRISQNAKNAEARGIFREKGAKAQLSPAVTPSSSTNSSSHRSNRVKVRYEEQLPGRYYENESRLSWEFEESPPVEISKEGEEDIVQAHAVALKSNDGKDTQSETESYCMPEGSEDSGGKRLISNSPQPKMRYRCKLCGQPKQNHTCPYQQSLARSIGVNVYPTVNAFAAAEPGYITQALSEMNNFVDSQKESSSNEASPNRPTPDRMRQSSMTGVLAPTNQVTPDSLRSSQVYSPSMPTSSISTMTPTRSNAIGRHDGVQGMKKRARVQLHDPTEGQGDLLFAEAMELKPEQFRTVTPLQSVSSGDSFNYPVLPLPYAQRKKLSDNLFSLSNEVPKLTDECAQVLREAREKDMWDLAVAELMTQVVVVIHCHEGDHRFEGLRQYLLTIGIAC